MRSRITDPDWMRELGFELPEISTLKPKRKKRAKRLSKLGQFIFDEIAKGRLAHVSLDWLKERVTELSSEDTRAD